MFLTIFSPIFKKSDKQVFNKRISLAQTLRQMPLRYIHVAILGGGVYCLFISDPYIDAAIFLPTFFGVVTCHGKFAAIALSIHDIAFYAFGNQSFFHGDRAAI